MVFWQQLRMLVTQPVDLMYTFKHHMPDQSSCCGVRSIATECCLVPGQGLQCIRWLDCSMHDT